MDHVLAPSDIGLVLLRLAGATGIQQVTVVGDVPLTFPDDLGLQITPARVIDDGTAVDGIVLLTSGASWEGLDGARAVVAVETRPDRSALDTLAAEQERAAAAGWHVAHASILHVSGDADRPARTEGCQLVACRPGDQLEELLDNGPLSLALDPALQTAGGTPRPGRVLIASYEIAGPTGNGGIGTAYHSLAHVLASAGHHVTLLFTGWMEPDRAVHVPRWRGEFAAAGIDFQLLGTPWDVPVRNPHHQVRRAYEFHRWLAEAQTRRPFDVVHAPETLGHAAFALTAKQLGFAYADVEFVVGTHSSTRWVSESNREAIEDLDQLVAEQLERLSVERADVVISPTAYMLDYMRDRGWSLPERTFVQPLARPRAVRELAGDAANATAQAREELVFFGRLETRKGLEAFCDAVDLLVDSGDCPFERVSFLGRPERVVGEEATAYIARRAEAWELPWSIMPDLGHAEAVAHLQETGCVVAIPSLVDNSPNTVIEVVALGVPFVASRSGGTGELIAAGDLADSTFDGWRESSTLEPPTFSDEQDPFDVRDLAEALRAKATGASTPPAPAVDDQACDRVYDTWHRTIAGRSRCVREATTQTPLTTAVCIVSDDDADVRRIAGVVGAGMRKPTQIVAIGDLDPSNQVEGVETIVARGRECGPARLRATSGLAADVLVVLRGNEQPDALLLDQVCTAFENSDTALLALITRDPDADRPTDTAPELRRTTLDRDLCAFVPIAGPAIASALYPALAVGPYAIRSSALATLGGYAADTWGEAIDHELLSRAALAGLRIDVLPDPVATTMRDDRWVNLRTHYWGLAPVPAVAGEEQIRLLRPFRRRIDRELSDVPALLVGATRASGRTAELTTAHVEERREIVDTYEIRARELVDAYETRIAEQRDLIALYEDQKEEMRAVIEQRGGQVVPAGRVRQGLRRATRGPVGGWPARGVRFARWRIELVRRKLR